MARRPEIPVQVTADNSGFRRGLNVAESDARRFKARVATGAAAFAPWAAAAGVAGAAGAAFVRSAIDVADSIDKASRAANIGAERLQTLRFAAEQSGIGTDKMDAALAKFNVTLGRVTSGMETASSSVSQAFAQLGLSVDELANSGLSTEQTLDLVYARLADIEDGAQQAAIAAQLFGRSAGPEMRNLLVNGVDGIKALETEARNSGGVIEEALIGRGVEIADKWNSIMNSMVTSAQQFALRAAKAIDDALGFTDTARTQIRERTQARVRAITDPQEDARIRRGEGRVDGAGFEVFDPRGQDVYDGRVNYFAPNPNRTFGSPIARDGNLLPPPPEPPIGGDLPGVNPNPTPTTGGASVPPGTGGGGGGGAGFAASDYERLAERWKTRLELLREKQAEEAAILAEARANGIIAEEEYQQRLTQLAEEYTATRRKLSREEVASRIDATLGASEQVLSAMGSFNERAERLARVAGATRALVNSQIAFTEVLKDPLLPWFARVPAAAGVLAAGLNVVGSLRSGGSGGAAGGGGFGGAGLGAAPAPLEARITGFDPGSLFTGDAVSSLFNRLQDEAGDRGLRFSFA